MKPLTVYKASAGSGKTFTLACEYIKLLIDNPYSFRSILAVTFTNKATEEMKLRILSQLYGIWKGLPESRDYLDIITRALGISQQQAAEKAGVALRHLIHHYNYFRVETIDSFFQSVLRNLARELDLTANLRIGLNDRQVEEMAVDHLIESLDKESIVLKWLIGYIFANISDNKSWNVIGAIKKFGENIFRDDYKNNSHQLSALVEKDFFAVYQKRMRQLRDEATKAMADYAQQFERITREAGLEPSSYAGKNRGICSYFNKLKGNKFSDANCINKTLNDCMESAEKWTTKSSADREVILRLAETQLMDLLRRAENDRKTKWRDYSSANATLRHLNELQLLNRIESKVRDLNNEANRFLLSDTQYLLHGLISESDSPFIFEKVGCHLEHIMIDEFQDTSTVQWMNFKVLLNECMSHATGHNDQLVNNLIVGDVKQSIYRWRSGDWRLLNNIEDQFDNPKKQLDVETLATNYRSDRNVINFNNAFFVEAAQQEYNELAETIPETAQQLLTAYADVEQEVPEKKKVQGYVEVRLLKTQEEDDENDAENKEDRMMQLCLQTVDELTARGVPTHRIAILVRNNRTIQDIAAYFMEHSDYEMVSDEAFRLDASQAVQILITALKLLMHPADDIARATLLKFAHTYLNDEKVVELITENRQKLLEMPLLDLTERLFTELHLGEIEDMKVQSAYVCAFYDKLNSFLTDNSSDIEAFLQEWENNLHEKSIHSDGIEGIRLITIHKSKGLEFDHVIMPYCDWQLEKANTIWCTPQEAPYNELPLVPVDFSAKQMKGSIYEDDYHHEHLQNIVDNLNLLYVAFTRASHNLYVFGKRASTAYRSGIIEKSLETVAEKLKQNAEKEAYEMLTDAVNVELEGIGTDSKTNDIIFKYGEPVVPKQKVKMEMKINRNVFTMPAEMMQIDINVSPKLPEFRQSNKSRDLIKGDEQEEQQKFYIKMGTVLHSLFSTIRTRDDIEGALKQLELDGVLYDENISRDRVEKMIRKRLESDKVSDWFSDRWKVFNECSIISTDKDGNMVEHRPDRVMKDEHETVVVDFKFGKPKPEYHDQIKGYMKLLESMGHAHVKGYLWYVYPNKIEEVL